jgi:lipopolysaccharide transport system permease protein
MLATVAADRRPMGLQAAGRLAAILKRRQLLAALVRKDFDQRYAGSALGLVWTQLYPLLLLAVYTFVFSAVFHNEAQHFVSFLFIGIVIWNFFNTTMTLSTSSIIANANLVTKVSFPRELLTLSVVIMGLIDLGMSHVILFAGMLLSGVRPTLSWIALPALIALLALFCTGVGLILASATVYLRDVRFFVEVAVLLLLFLSPVFYTATAVPAYALWLMKVSPLALVISDYRYAVLNGGWPLASDWAVLCVAAAVMLWAGLETFARAERGFPDAL